MNFRCIFSLAGRSLAALLPAMAAVPLSAQVYWQNQGSAGITDDIWCVTYANGTFAAVTNKGNVLTSPDGLVWSSQFIVGYPLVSITYGDGKWVAVGGNGTIGVSTDLKLWTGVMSGTTNKLNGVLYNGSVFLAVGDSATILISSDAIAWTTLEVPATLGITGFLHGITLLGSASNTNSPDFLVSGALAGNGTGSVDTGVILQVGIDAAGLFDGQLYIVQLVGIGPTVNPELPQLTPVGTTVGNLEAILCEPAGNSGGDSFPTVAVGWEGTIIYGAEIPGYQTPTAAPPGVAYRGLAYGDGYWVVAGEQGTILTSTDTMTWTQRPSGDSPASLSTSTLLSAAFSPTLERFVITGTGGTILVSNAATPTVLGNVSTRGSVSGTQTLIGGFVVKGFSARTVLIRADGPALSAFGVSSPLPDPVLTVYIGQDVVATNTGWTTNANPALISAAATAVGAFALPNPSKDSAVLLTLQPGAYTVVITSAGKNSGTALFEAYTY